MNELHKMIIRSCESSKTNIPIIKAILKFYEYLINDIHGNATSKTVQENILNNQGSLIINEDELQRSHSNDNFDLGNYSYFFVVIAECIKTVFSQFSKRSSEHQQDFSISEYKIKVLGLKKYFKQI